jgi:hypothetical protein
VLCGRVDLLVRRILDTMTPDVFLCHATEDKEVFVRPLAEALSASGLRVWYDEFSLKPGDSIRTAIDLGLKSARYCVVVLSPRFFGRNWTEWELNGIVQLHLSAKRPMLIPVWLDVKAADVRKASPSLADVYAVRATAGALAVAAQIAAIVTPKPRRHAAMTDDDLVRRSLELVELLAGARAGDTVRVMLRALHQGNLHDVSHTGDAWDLLPKPIPLNASISGFSARENKLVVTDAINTAGSTSPDIVGRHRSFLVTPLARQNGDVYGVISINAPPDHFREEALRERIVATTRVLGPLLDDVVARRLNSAIGRNT